MKQKKLFSLLLALALALSLLPDRALAAPADSSITTYFTLVGDTAHGENGPVHIYKQGSGAGRTWIAHESVRVPAGTSAFAVFDKVLAEHGISYEEKSASYIFSLTSAGVTLSGDTNGQNCGWLYLVNGISPTVGLRDYTLSDGDELVVYYTDDYTQETGSGGMGSTDTPSVSLPFTDVPTDSWYYENAAFCYTNGILKGNPATQFSPESAMSRAMFATALYRLAGSPLVSGGTAFADVPSGSWYANAAAWASQNGLVKGVDAAHFAPEAALTREQAATLLYRCAQLKKWDVSIGEDTNILSYTDAESISAYAVSAVQWACGSGVLHGSGNRLSPNSPVSRAQAAALLQRFSALAK